MKHMRQFLIILFFTCIGEILHEFIPLPIPSSIYGLVLLLSLIHIYFNNPHVLLSPVLLTRLLYPYKACILYHSFSLTLKLQT